MDAGEHQPAWSPDGRSMALRELVRRGRRPCLSRRRPTAAPRRSSPRSPSFYSDPVYSLDGQRIVVVRGPRAERQEDFSPQGRGGQAMELVWLPAGGGETTLITPFRGQGRPHFAKDPARIYVWEGSRGLVSFRFDGTDRKTHVKVTGYKNPNAEQASNASEVIMGPDGEHAIAEAQHHVYLLTVPVKGGEAPTVALASPRSASRPGEETDDRRRRVPVVGRRTATVTFALGRTLFKYDLDAGEAAEEKEKKEAEAKKDAEKKPDPEKKDEKPEPRRSRPTNRTRRKSSSRLRARSRAARVVLRGARVITMKGNEVIENADIVVTDNRIVEVGRRGQVQVAGRRAGRSTSTGKTIMPGLVDIHAHIWPARDDPQDAGLGVPARTWPTA